MTLEIDSVSKQFGNLLALDDVSLSIAEGALVCFLGPSGCGKTTLLRIIAGLETTNSGKICMGGQDLLPVPARKRNFGVVFQSYSLFPNLTIAANVAYGLECRKWERNDIERRVYEMLDLVHLTDQAVKYPHQLSGGQQQRIALARALAPNPSVLLLDEPLSALDAKVREELREEIRQLQKRLGITTVMVTHDQEEALSMADQIVVMQAGRIMQTGSADDLYRQPENRFVAEFIGRMNIVEITDQTPGIFSNVAGGPSVIGFRPEDVNLSIGHDANGLSGEISRVTRLGNLTRITLRVTDDAYPDSCGPVLAEIQGMNDSFVPGMPCRFSVSQQSLCVLETN